MKVGIKKTCGAPIHMHKHTLKKSLSQKESARYTVENLYTDGKMLSPVLANLKKEPHTICN